MWRPITVGFCIPVICLVIGIWVMNTATKQRIFFLDVGLASANLIDLGDNRYIIIDGGTSKNQHGNDPVLETLKQCIHQSQSENQSSSNDDSIEYLAISHLHEDHWRGLLESVHHARTSKQPSPLGKIRRLILIDGRDWDELVDWTEDGKNVDHQLDAFLEFASELVELNPEIEVATAYASSESSQRFELDDSASTLELLYPDASKVSKAETPHTRNIASGMFLFTSGLTGDRFVFSGDAPLAAWESIIESNSTFSKRLPIEVLAVSHHGGIAWDHAGHEEKDRQVYERTAQKLRRVFREILEISFAFVSVGSDGAKHPRRIVVELLKECGAQVMCSQLAHECRCSLDPTHLVELTFNQQSKLDEHEGAKLGLKSLPGASRPKNLLKGNHHLGCASTVVAVVERNSGTKVYRADQHARVVKELERSGAKPICSHSFTEVS